MEPIVYVGSKQVAKIEGNIVYFENGDSETYTERSLKYLLSVEPISESDLQNNTVNAIAQDVLNIFAEHDIRFSDVNLVMNKIKWSTDQYTDKALCKAAGLLDKYEGNIDVQTRNIRIGQVRAFLES